MNKGTVFDIPNRLIFQLHIFHAFIALSFILGVHPFDSDCNYQPNRSNGRCQVWAIACLRVMPPGQSRLASYLFPPLPFPLLPLFFLQPNDNIVVPCHTTVSSCNSNKQFPRSFSQSISVLYSFQLIHSVRLRDVYSSFTVVMCLLLPFYSLSCSLPFSLSYAIVPIARLFQPRLPLVGRVGRSDRSSEYLIIFKTFFLLF